MYEILGLVFAKLRTSSFWEITPDFVTRLGQLYLELLSTRYVRIEHVFYDK